MHPHARIVRTVALAALVAVPAHALTRHVPSEYATINAGLDASAFGDTVLVAPGTYTDVESRDVGLGVPFTACAFLHDGVVLRSSGGPDVTTIDMMNAPALQPDVILGFFLDSDETVVQGFTVTGVPTSGHGVKVSFSGKVTLKDCILRDMDAGQSTGGGAAINGDFAITDCEFVNCRGNAGGGLYHSGGHLEMTGTTFRECSNKAASLHGDPPDVESAWIENCTFLNNYSDGNSGGIQVFAYDGGATFTGCHFEGNVAETAAGAIGWGGAGAKTIEDCTFLENGVVGANAEGGAITIGGTGPCVIRGNTFYGNYQVDGTFGGAVLEVLTPTTLENNIVSFASGGTAITTSGGLTTSCNVFWNNTDGPGIPLSETDRDIDPLFCDPSAGVYTLSASSPCLPGSDPSCSELIGALGVGCGTTGVAPTTWGRIKGAYRPGASTR